ncbi:tetratricopeptide repeat protein [Nautilia sp.]
MKKVMLLISLVIGLFALDIKKAYYESYNYEKMGDYKDAIKVLIPVYKKYPKGYTINLRLGWLFYLSKKYQNALDHYKKASLTAPYSIEAKLGIMRAYMAAGDYDNALKVGDVILKIDYYNYYGNYYEIVSLIAEKKYDTALKLTNKMLGLYPTSVLFLTELGKIYFVKDKKKARKIFEDILILDPNNVVAKEYLKK